MSSKTCCRCRGVIDTSIDRYVQVRDNKGKENIQTLWYHKECWHEVMTAKSALNNMVNRTKKLLGITEEKMGIKEEVINL